MDYLADRDAVITVKFRLGNQPVVPSLANYNLYDTEGAVILANEEIILGPTSTQVNITVEATDNTIAQDRRFEKRTVLVSYTVAGEIFTQRITYRVIPYLNIDVTPEKVRGYVGCDIDELPDNDIDIVKAYYQVEDAIGAANLTTALAAGDLREIAVNNAIIYQVALNVIPSLQLRVAQERRDGPLGFTRPTIRDFSKLYEITQDELSAALNVASGRIEAPSSLAVLSQPVDPVTGA